MRINNNNSNDSLEDRMKIYEDINRFHLIPRSYAFVRIDGKSFHSYCKNLNRPFDKGFMDDMDATAVYLCENVQNAKLGFVQSDEISLLLCDFDTLTTAQFFDGNIQKISSVVASMATAKFNELRADRQVKYAIENDIDMSVSDRWPLAMFDGRCWNVPNNVEAMNVFRWRQQDCIRNSVSMVSQSNFSHKELHGKSQVDMHEMLHQKGVNWATDFTDGEKNGRIIVKELYRFPSLGKLKKVLDAELEEKELVERTRWVAQGAWVFTKDEGKLLNMIPKYE